MAGTSDTFTLWHCDGKIQCTSNLKSSLIRKRERGETERQRERQRERERPPPHHPPIISTHPQVCQSHPYLSDLVTRDIRSSRATITSSVRHLDSLVSPIHPPLPQRVNPSQSLIITTTTTTTTHHHSLSSSPSSSPLSPSLDVNGFVEHSLSDATALLTSFVTFDLHPSDPDSNPAEQNHPTIPCIILIRTSLTVDQGHRSKHNLRKATKSIFRPS